MSNKTVMGRPGFVELKEGGRIGACVQGLSRGFLVVTGEGAGMQRGGPLSSWARASSNVL